MWNRVEIEDCTRRTISLEAASVWGVRGFSKTPRSVNREPFIHAPPPHSLVCHVSLCTEKKVQLSIFTCAPRNHPPVPVYSYLSHISPHILFSIFTLKAPYCIYIMIIPDFFFTVNVFVLHPILFGSLLVALMWNVCAEPIECCVYIKATLFLTIPVFVVWVWLLKFKCVLTSLAKRIKVSRWAQLSVIVSEVCKKD